MAPSFGRSISFSPLSPARSFSKASKAAAARHVRSISLPTSRTHPLLTHLHNTVRAVRDWTAQPASASAGLAHVDVLHAALAELLMLPEARTALSAGSAAADCLLDGFLALADAYGSFQEAVIELKRHAADVQAALRRCDAARLASAVRAQRQAEKDIARLASSVHSKIIGASATAAEADVSGLLAEAMAAVACASAAVFSAVEFTSSAATTAAASSSSKKSTIISLVKRSTTSEHKELLAIQRLQDLDDCIMEIQAGSDKVFRSILNTRVALLNIQTQTC